MLLLSYLRCFFYYSGYRVDTLLRVVKWAPRVGSMARNCFGKFRFRGNY